MIEDLEKGLIGLSAEESVTIPVTFPDDYQAENLKGKAAEFEVSVKKLQEPKIRPLRCLCCKNWSRDQKTRTV